MKIALRIEEAPILGLEPAILHDLLGCFLILIIAFHKTRGMDRDRPIFLDPELVFGQGLIAKGSSLSTEIATPEDVSVRP
jgi:hypothetical protein